MKALDRFLDWCVGKSAVVQKKKPMKIQSLIFSKDQFTAESAKAWAKQHGYATGVDETGSSFRFRQADPDKYDTMRTIELKTGIKAVVGKRVEKSQPGSSSVHVPVAGEEEKIGKGIGKEAYSGDNLLKVKRAELVTFPKDVSGSNCANCKFSEDNECKHPLMNVELVDGAENMCCDYWDRAGTVHWGEANVAKSNTSVRRVAKIAVRHQNHMLMGKRRDNGKWTMPGGHVDPDETMHEGALRELLEETGIDIPPTTLEVLSPVDDLIDGNGKPLQVQAFGVRMSERPGTSMLRDPDGEVERWRWVDMSKGLPEHIKKELHVPAERCNLLQALGLVQKIAKAAIDVDGDDDMFPGIDNLEAGLLKSALSDDNENVSTDFTQQQLVEGMDWELGHTTQDEDMAREAAIEVLTSDPNHYQKLRMQDDGSDDVLTKDVNENEENPYDGEGLALDLGSGQAREFGHIGLDLYPHDHGTIIHDLHQGIPFDDGSARSIRMTNSLEHMDELSKEPGPLLAEVHRVLAPGGEFLYEGPNDIYDAEQWKQDYPGFVLIHQEDNIAKDKQPENTLYRQQFARIAVPDAATANDAEPRMGVGQIDELPFDQLLAADVMSYYYSDATTSGKGNRLRYPSQGAISKEGACGGSATMSTGPVRWIHKDKLNEMMGVEEKSPIQLEMHEVLNPKNPNPAPPKRLARKSAVKKGWMKKGGPGSGPRPGSGKGGGKAPAKGSNGSKPHGSGHEGGHASSHGGGHSAGHGGGHGHSIGEMVGEGLEHAAETADKSSTIEKVLKSGRIVPIIKSNNEKQIVYGVILAPNEIDSQDDYMEAEDIEKAAHSYLTHSRMVGSEHSKSIGATPVESFIAPQDFEVSGQYGDQPVKKGSWVLGVKIKDPEEWEKVKSGEYTGFSVGGVGLRQEQ